VAHQSDEDRIESTRNTARFFTENRHVSWIAMLAVLVWGAFGYASMPKQKDPLIPVHIAVASAVWPGADTLRMEELVTRAIEEKIGESTSLHEPDPGIRYAIKSLTLPGVAVVDLQLEEGIQDADAVYNDIAIKLDELSPTLPSGVQPIQFNSNFGQVSTLMVTMASPLEDEIGIDLRARALESAIRKVRSDAPAGLRESRVTLVVAFPRGAPETAVSRYAQNLRDALSRDERARDIRIVAESGIAALDVFLSQDARGEDLLALARRWALHRLGAPGFHPDAWDPVVIEDPAQTKARLASVAGAKYAYHELDDFSDLVSRSLRTVASVAKVGRSGVLPEEILLAYSQDVLASYGLEPSKLRDILMARDIVQTGGVLELNETTVQVSATGAFTDPGQIGDTLIATSSGAPVYLRDVVDVIPTYQSPPRFLNYYGRADEQGRWVRTRAVTLSVVMREGEQVQDFGIGVDEALARATALLPGDLVLARTSDQPLQVEENVDLFMEALYEAVALVVLVALLGFWEWRSALLMALAIPLTLAMTFGMMSVLGVAIQQVSLAALIIALGLLVDDPVVAGDAIKRELAAGRSRIVAAWLGPTKLGRAILFATLTNVIAYLPFLLLPGNSGEFVHSLPIVMTCALVSSRIVSMTFVPLLGSLLLRAPTRPEPSIEERRSRGFTGFYFRLGSSAIEHRYLWAAGSLVFLVFGVFVARQLDTSFFPEDVQYLSYVDVWLPTDASLSATNAALELTESTLREVIDEASNAEGRELLRSITAFVGGGSPRFWFSLSPESQQLNYGMLLIELTDKEATPRLVGPMQRAVQGVVPGASIAVHQLETNPVGNPIEVEVAGRFDLDPDQEHADIRELRRIAAEVETILRSVPEIGIVRNDWSPEVFSVRLDVDPDRANLAGVTNADVATSVAAGLTGISVGTLYQGDDAIPIVVRLRGEERANLAALSNLYVFSSEDQSKIPLLEIARIQHELETQRIVRREQFRAITVAAIPAPGELASVALNAAMPRLEALIEALPDGYTIQFGGELAKQQQGNRNLSRVLAISALAIFLALVVQFNHAFKPVLVFSAVPFGAVGAIGALYLTGEPFGFMAFLGIIALIGVIVSHVIVLFDFIEVNHEKGEPLRESLLDAGIVRLRPIMITVGATILALFPLAIHGGPLWQPLCYAQIGGLALATFIELLLVKVFYAIAVLDLKLVRWSDEGAR
jgi:multidrug efflux pump subunit AcrB